MRATLVVLLVAAAACAPRQTMFQVGPDTWMIEIAGGDPACLAYRLQSPTQATVQALFYRKRDGTFTMNRLEACGAP
ncbi:MAG: hypothetical protein FJX64_01460 [Alphaproteobacteria bacterium]|nr:hypothetical protein [Alphaproteobacteria bacterium]